LAVTEIQRLALGVHRTVDDVPRDPPTLGGRCNDSMSCRDTCDSHSDSNKAE
jgi:hypothetical protein